MLIIRLQRTGKKNQSDFRIVLAEKTAAAQKKFVELLGSYNPHKKTFQIQEDRVKYWLGQRVSLSPTIHNLFVDKGFVTQAKVKAFNIPKKPAPAETAAAPAEAPSAEAPAGEKISADTVPATEEAKTEEKAA